jgi:hypothetical protein
VRLLRPSRLMGRTANRLLGKTFALLAPLAFKLGVTQRVPLLILTGVAVAVVVVLVLLAAGLLGSFEGG